MFLFSGITSPTTYTNELDLSHVIKLSQPPVIEPPPHRLSDLTRTSILRINESDRNRPIVVHPPTVHTRDVIMGRARRTLTDDGSADVVHHVGIISPPTSFSIVKRPTVTTSTTDQYELPQISTIAPPDFADRSQILIRQRRIQSNIAQPSSDDLIDSALSTTQPILIKDDHDPRLRRPVQVKNEKFH